MLPSAHLADSASPVPTPSALQLSRLVKRYRAGTSCCTALDGVTLCVHRGDIVVIAGDAKRGRVGPRTVLWCVARIVRPTAGEIRWHAGDAYCAPPAVALVALDAPLPERWRVCDVLQHATPAGIRQCEADRLVAEATHECGLQGLAAIHTLSAAVRWRVQLGRAVAAGAEWVLLDLPAAGSSRGDEIAAARAALVAVAERARRIGGAVMAAADGNGPLDDGIPAARRFSVAAGVLMRAVADRDARRVAERR